MNSQTQEAPVAFGGVLGAGEASNLAIGFV